MLRKFLTYTFALIGLMVLFTGCKKEYESIQSQDERLIQDYLTANNIIAVKDSSGFYYQIVEQGDSGAVINSDSVYYSFNFKHTSDVSFVKSSDYRIPVTFLGYTDRFTFGQSQYLIAPIRLALSKLHRGGSARVIIPSSMIFGKNGNTDLGVESNEIVIVDLQLYAEDKQWEIDELVINKFVADNKLQVIKDPSRVRYTISSPGTGTDVIMKNSTLTMNYTGRLLDGTVFDPVSTGTTTSTITSALNGLIKGWGDVIPGKLTSGGKIRLIIPSDRGYGVNGSGSIPGNTALDFDIEITKVVN